MIVLLQTGKGADMGAIFGGGSSQTLFGSTGATTFLTKLTTGAAIIFMATSLIITYVSSHRTTKSVMIDLKAPSQTQTQRVDVTPKAKSLPEKKGVESSQEK